MRDQMNDSDDNNHDVRIEYDILQRCDTHMFMCVFVRVWVGFFFLYEDYPIPIIYYLQLLFIFIVLSTYYLFILKSNPTFFFLWIHWRFHHNITLLSLWCKQAHTFIHSFIFFLLINTQGSYSSHVCLTSQYYVFFPFLVLPARLLLFSLFLLTMNNHYQEIYGVGPSLTNHYCVGFYVYLVCISSLIDSYQLLCIYYYYLELFVHDLL